MNQQQWTRRGGGISNLDHSGFEQFIAARKKQQTLLQRVESLERENDEMKKTLQSMASDVEIIKRKLSCQ